MYLHLGRAEPAPRATGETPGAVTPLALTRVLDTKSEPFSCICRIHVRTANRGNSFGTGVLISPYHVLTCAHVLYPRQDPHAMRVVTVLPGQNGPDDKRPGIRSNGWAISPAWRWNDCRTAGDDLAIIRLGRPSNVGFWPIAPFDPSILVGATAHLAGYPSCMRDEGARCATMPGWMYRSRGRIIGRIQMESCSEPTNDTKERLVRTLWRDINDTVELIAHGLDTRPSMSGGPMWTFGDRKRVFFAVHAGDIDDGARKKAILLNTKVRKRIADWMTLGLPALDTRPR